MENNNSNVNIKVLKFHLVILEQTVQKLSWILQKAFSCIPVVIDLLSELLSCNLLGFDTLQDTDGFYNQLHSLRRPLHSPHLQDV